MRLKEFIHKITAFVMVGAMTLNIGGFCAYGAPEWPSDTGVMADFGIVMDVDSKAVLFGQQIHVPSPPASITKLLTALVVVEHASMDEIVEFSHDAVYNVESGSGNKMSLEEGDRLSVEDCLYLLILQSSNQAANALAEHVAGSREAFADMMNDKAASLGCLDGTYFTNPSGLNDDAQKVSAYDMALIAIAAFENEKVLEISSSKFHEIPATVNNPEGVGFRMEHRILMADSTDGTYYCEGAAAGKIGYTSLAGNTLVTYAVRDGRRQVSVILKGSQPQYYIDGKNLLNFGFRSFINVGIAENETLFQGIEQIEIGGVSYEVSDLAIEEEGVITLPNGGQFTDASRSLDTDIPQDAPAGSVAILQYTYNDRKVGAAYIYQKSVRAAAIAEAERESREAEAATATATEASLDEDLSQSDVDTLADPTVPEPRRRLFEGMSVDFGGMGIYIAAVVGVLVVIAAGGLLIWRKRKKEREAAARRRERRRQRLQDIGYSEEEFEKLMEERRGRGREH